MLGKRETAAWVEVEVGVEEYKVDENKREKIIEKWKKWKEMCFGRRNEKEK